MPDQSTTKPEENLKPDNSSSSIQSLTEVAQQAINNLVSALQEAHINSPGVFPFKRANLRIEGTGIALLQMPLYGIFLEDQEKVTVISVGSFTAERSQTGTFGSWFLSDR